MSKATRVTFCTSWLLAVGAVSAFAECSPPPYAVGYVQEDSPSVAYVNISIPLDDFTPRRLVCLAGVLRKKYENRPRIEVWIFSSPDAAKYYRPSEREGPVKTNTKTESPAHSRDLHAIYAYDSEKRQEFIDIKPRGCVCNLPSDMRVNLPISEIPRCKYQINGRCVLSVDAVSFPGGPLGAKASGTVALLGRVTANGRVTDVRVVEANITPLTYSDELVKNAKQHVATWRLEPASREDTFTTTYSYVIDVSLAQPGSIGVELSLPEKVTVRAKPIR